MAMGRKKKQRQEALFVATADLPRTPGHPFYEYLNQVLAAVMGSMRWWRNCAESSITTRWGVRACRRACISGCC